MQTASVEKGAAAAKKSAQTADLGASTIDAFTALGNTAASAGLLAFKLAKGATGDLQETLKAKAPKDFDP